MHPYPPHRRRDYTKPRRWQPLADEEWDELLPFVLVQNRPGGPLRDARKRIDAIFWIAASGAAWHTLPPRFGKADTVSRHFRRLAQAGLWERLLRALEHWVCCAYRRATRLRGLRMVALARRLGFLSALKAPSWLLPDPHLSELVFSKLRPAMLRARQHGLRVLPQGFLRCYNKLLAIAAGKRRIRRCLQPV